MQLIYVMRHDDAATLAELGFTLLKEDLRNAIWVFAPVAEKLTQAEFQFMLKGAGVQYTLSNTLTF